MKKIISLLLIAVLSFSVCVPALAVVEQSEQFYVADYANVLSPDTEKLICDYNGALEQQCEGAQIVVVTVDYLDGMYSDEYAVKLFNDWGVGSAEHNNGVLLLLAIEENKFWMTQGMGITSSLTNSDIDYLLDNFLADKFDAGLYDSAVQDTFMQLLGWFDEHYSAQVIASNPALQQQYEQNKAEQYEQNKAEEEADAFSVFLTIIIIVLIVIILTSGKRNRRRYTSTTRRTNPWFPFWLGHTMGRGHRPPSRPHHNPWDDDDDHFGGFGGGGFGGGFGGFGGGSGFGGGGFSGGGGGGRR